MMIKHTVRRFSSRTFVDKWFNALQSTIHNGQQSQLIKCIEYSLQQDPAIQSTLVKDIIHRWTVEQPTKTALWTTDANKNEYQKLTFNDIYRQSSDLAKVLTGKEFNLTAGKNILVILPYSTKERLLIQLVCLQNDLVFRSYDPRYLNEKDIRQQIRTSAIDCIITNIDYLEMIMNCTYNSLRPLKKGLVNYCSTLKPPLPIGWHSLTPTENNDTEIDCSQLTKRSCSHLTNDRSMNQYSQARFTFRQLLIAYWLHMNRLPELIWVRDDRDRISFAPWLLGSGIFYQETDNIGSILRTFEKYPIDSFCAPQHVYQMLDKQHHQQLGRGNDLKQLLSTETIIDPTTKTRWYSLTNLHIHDDYSDMSADLNSKSDTQSSFKKCLTHSIRCGPSVGHTTS